ncbi:alpha-N-arabinofuranosidase [Jatrophihabitans telluris]|uniref:non-reducing end alpha-L-arabinofuranosidase n=1 Tax=Jatrophihabitans telluris TaxID=2038343 RepID=A0ABY4R010_9ACTN|nr:alpha-N-arabinofuranosidase [Jatrophihabitans telluris]UQX89179.1 alpha-N-arabinofuranosidase [Jatrophihabitans telluris]
MITSSTTLDPAFVIAPVPPRLFGSFVEHMGRCVYQGIFEPGDRNADADGLRRDVLELTRELGVSVVRYPGGNFVSGYNWEDGIGPIAERPVRLDLAWRSLEPNTFGLNEFMRWVEQCGAEPMMAVNLGTRGVAEAAALLEYTNFAGGTRYSDLRIKHGRREPYNIKLWCLGNEMDGPWQIGHKNADDYGRLAAETGKAMRLVDPSVELVACGSSHQGMPTFGAWEVAVLEHAYDQIDYLSLHAYYKKSGEDLVGYLASADAMDSFIDGVVSTCDHVAATRRTRKQIKLSFDEWNIEHRPYWPEEHQDEAWATAPRIAEDEYNAEDAVVVGNLLISLLRHSDRVAIACQAQLVNVIAPIRAESGVDAWRQTVFHPFALTARHARGEVLRVEVRSDTILESATRGDVRPVDATATRNPETGDITLFVVNRADAEAALFEVLLATEISHRVVEHLVLGGERLDDRNTPENPQQVIPRSSSEHQIDGQLVRLNLPPASWTMLRLEPARG